MIWSVSDDGSARVRLSTSRGLLVKPPQVMVREYAENVVADLGKAGITVLSDEYRVRMHTGGDQIDIIWNARIRADDVPAMREYLANLAASYAGD